MWPLIPTKFVFFSCHPPLPPKKFSWTSWIWKRGSPIEQKLYVSFSSNLGFFKTPPIWRILYFSLHYVCHSTVYINWIRSTRCQKFTKNTELLKYLGIWSQQFERSLKQSTINNLKSCSHWTTAFAQLRFASVYLNIWSQFTLRFTS